MNRSKFAKGKAFAWMRLKGKSARQNLPREEEKLHW
jgi:hypothetical protein